MLGLILQAVGLITALSLLWRIYGFIHLYFLHTSKLPQYLHAGTKSYALVTGASDGIGLALSQELLNRGFNIILHSRNHSKLSNLRSRLQQQHPDRNIVIVAADASQPDTSIPTIVKCVEEKMEASGGRLTVLVNNVGGTAMLEISSFTPLKDMPPEIARKSLDLNAKFPTLLTHALLPRLVANAPKPGLVINLGSYAGVYGLPFLSIYGPSKAFNLTFSASLDKEMKLMGVPVEVWGVVVGSVKTPGNTLEEDGFQVLTAEVMAQSILERVGCGKSVIVGNWRQSAAGGVMRWLPEKLAERVLAQSILVRIEREKKLG